APASQLTGKRSGLNNPVAQRGFRAPPCGFISVNTKASSSYDCSTGGGRKAARLSSNQARRGPAGMLEKEMSLETFGWAALEVGATLVFLLGYGICIAVPLGIALGWWEE